jgi:hypothetical protein
VNGDPSRPIRTEAVRTRILLRVRHGTPQSVAAIATGVSKSSFFEWKKSDPDFAAALDEAYNAWVDSLLTRAEDIVTTGEERVSAQMLQWLLERRVFSFFARKERVATSDPNGDPDEAHEYVEATAGGPGPSLDDVERETRAILDLIGRARAGSRPVDGAAGEPPGEPAEAVRPARSNGHANRVPPTS